MTDIVTPEVRSRMMRGIRGRNTLPELRLRSALFRLGYRYRLHQHGLPGRPDIVFPGRKAVIFVHGCFWHRHEDCRYTTTPASNTAFWMSKFSANVARDRAAAERLELSGWQVLVVWECELRPGSLDATVSGVVARLGSCAATQSV